MPEQPKNTTDEINKSIEEERRFQLEHNPDATDVYLRDKVTVIESGEPTWMRRNFDSDSGEVYDFYKNGQLVGYVDHADGYWTAFVAGPGIDEPFAVQFKSRMESFQAIEESVDMA